MANLTEVSNFDSGVYQLEVTDPVFAGTGGNGVSNAQAKNLANRTRWLYDQLASILAGTSNNFTSMPIFDATQNAANTAFVQYNSGRLSNSFSLNANVIIGSGFFGWLFNAGALITTDNLTNNNVILSLASLATLPAGAKLVFKNNATFTYTLKASGSELFYAPNDLDSGTSGQNTIIVHPGDCFSIVRSETNSILGTGIPYWHIIIHNGNLHNWIVIGATGAPAFQNSWVNIGGGNSVARFLKAGNKVYLAGNIRSGTSGTAAFSFPTGYFPNKDLFFQSTTFATGTLCTGYIKADGFGQNIIPTTTSGNAISLDGIVIPLD